MRRIKKPLTLSEKKARYGYLFILPLLFGLIFLFGIPMIKSVVFSVSQIGLGEKGFDPRFSGFTNYYSALFVETEYRKVVFLSVANMLLNVPLITIFSFFTATVLNQRFRGRSIVRVIFFLPLVMASSALMSLDSGDLLQSVMGSAAGGFKESQSVTGFESVNITYALLSSGLPQPVINYLLAAADRIYEIVVLSGVQILIFLAGLQSIPRSVYEAASIEGATAWETYWKITFPMISPLILTSVIYTIIDSFTMSNNKTIKMIQDTAFVNQNFGLSAAMSWIYFMLIMLIIGAVYLSVSKWIHYSDN